jgi:hypothetical protein
MYNRGAAAVTATVIVVAGAVAEESVQGILLLPLKPGDDESAMVKFSS